MTAFLSIGFRPFYLGAGTFAVLAIPLWVVTYLFGTPLRLGDSPYLWHMHEMLWGFAPAVIGGFLLTAVRNWTGRTTPAGGALAGLFGLWLIGRILPFFDLPVFTVLVDLLFLPVLALCVAVPLWRSGNRRNAFVVAILVALWLADAAFHASTMGWAPVQYLRASTGVAMDLILVLISVIGGRIIPAFSANAVTGLRPRTWPALDGIAIGLLVLIAAIDLSSPWASVSGGPYRVLLCLAAVAHLIRLAAWQPWRTWRNVLLLVLPLAYLWIPVHLLLRAAQDGVPGFVPPAAAHALFVGAMASMMLAMMTRSALGHTGRPLTAGAPEIVCFIAIHLAALLRVFGPLISVEHYGVTLMVAGGLWTLAFTAFVVAYAPRLVAPRAELPGSAQRG